jgi:hypothetical protein
MPEPLLIFSVSWQLLRKQTFFVNEPPQQKQDHTPSTASGPQVPALQAL